MGRIQFVQPDEVEFVSAAEIARAGAGKGQTRDGEGDVAHYELDDAAYAEELNGSEVKTYLRGDEDVPQLFEVRVAPNVHIREHAHSESEAIVVQEGELHIGRRIFGPGSVVAVPEYTLYKFQAGPTGLRFLNFRARSTGDLTQGVLSKSELLEYQKKKKSQETGT